MSKTEENEIQNYDHLFKDVLTKESNYEFFLKAQSLLKKELKKNSNSPNYISLLLYSINHLNQSDDKQSINSLLDFALEQYITKNKVLPDNIPKQDILKGFLKAFSICKGLYNTNNFRVKFLYYCKKNNVDEKTLKLYKCYDLLAKGCIAAKEYIDAYNYCIKSENVNILIELFDDLEKVCESLKDTKDSNNTNIINDIKNLENPLFNYKLLFKKLDKEELNLLILRTTLELLINQKIDIAFDFIGNYFKKDNQNAIINFGYNLVCLMIRKPQGFDDFWSLINIYKGVVEKRFDIQKYLNKISKIYYNKPFLNKNE